MTQSLPDIIINRRRYRHISQFSDSPTTIRQRIFRTIKTGKKPQGYKLPAGWWLPIE